MKQFKTESKKLLDLMINSIYTNKEIFLRELISNASDALDKLSFEAIKNPDLGVDQSTLAIRLSFDKEARSVTVSDNGIGMTKAELDENLGTIAHSGSEQFREANADRQGEDIDIIGQFGVGFYSSFMVATKVRVVSRALGADEAFVWESDGVRGYSIEPAGEGERSGAEEHGTDVILFLRESSESDDTDQYLSEGGLRDLVTRYSNYVRHPIQMMVTKSRQKPKPEDAPDDYKPEYEDYQELDTLNSMTPIWKKRQSEVKQEDYNEFYQSTFHDWSDPARTVSFHAEGALSYDALLFIPSRRPFDLYSKDYEKGLALYSSNVLIQEKCADLVPDYYNFVHGVVDSPDVSLNISRETLQQNSQLRAIARRVEKKIHSELEDMRDNDRESYETFFENFGRGIKFGIYNSYGMKAADLADLLLFWSAQEGKQVTFAEYADAMPEGQDKIYFAAGDSRERLEQVPAVRSALDHGFDVLLCTQDVDEFMFQVMRSWHQDGTEGDSEHEGAKERDLELANVANADLDFATDDEKAEAEKATSEHQELFDDLKESLGDKVTSVRVAAGLGDAPATIASEGPVSLEMERVISQGPDADAASAPKAQRVLQLNATHPVFAKLVAAKEAGDKDRLALLGSILYDQALLVEGLPVDDPVEFARNVAKLM
ncbi:chaperone protein HtpG [Olsenella sp. oral taxon 807]|uniref:molecular chaperone HtpG n=1 Tax=Olsenella sp. oral taxon 807 TaxID=712411 RepID=UPI000679FA62|nr:molecular chaperone HtpG [Olsenella sp. oral taxon 807]AKT49124.1 chaperone protein HtpG [Olsenella sp. oral taxon 807]